MDKLKLTKAEEELMQIIWDLGECTVGDIRTYLVERMGQKKPPHSTISTLVRILDKKGFITHKAYGRTFVYTPAVSQQDYRKQSLHTLVSDYFNGSSSQLVSFLVKENDLSLNDLNSLLDQLEEE